MKGLLFSATLLLLLHQVVLATPSNKDCNIPWPTPNELMEFGATLDGEIFFPGTEGYLNGSVMMNTRYNSEFGVVVMVANTSDVQKAILFCKPYGIRPTVKCTGHDYIGRSAGNCTFSINLARLNHMGKAVTDDRSETGYSMQVGPGSNFARLYKHVSDEGFLLQGGSAHTVSPGGYTQGGGHGPMSRMLGLGLDNVIEFTIVTPEGNIIKMTNDGGKIKKVGSSTWEDYKDPDLFWSVRGGGGGTFGVVTSYTFQIHHPPAGGFCHLSLLYPLYHSINGNVGEKVLRVWNEYLLHNLTRNWGGVILFQGVSGPINASDPNSPTVQGSLAFSLLHHGTCLEGKAGVNAILNMYPQYQFYAVTTPYPTFWDYEKDVHDDVGYRNYIINRLIQREDLLPDSKLPEVFSKMAKIPEVAAQVGCTWMLLGGKVSDYAVKSSAASPEFRSAYGSMSCGIVWLYEQNDAKNIRALQDYGKQFYTVGKGMYYNEPDYFVEDWKQAYWGGEERYKRLENTKKKYDPDNMFWCHNCVGSDIASHTNKVLPSASLIIIIYAVFSCILA